VKKILALGLIVLLTGCATVGHGGNSTADVQVQTDPPGATVRCSGQQITTPGSLNLTRAQDHILYFEKTGYKPISYTLHSKVQGKDVGGSFITNTVTTGWWTLGIGTAAGMIVDAASGSMKDLETKSVLVKLEQIEEPAKKN